MLKFLSPIFKSRWLSHRGSSKKSGQKNKIIFVLLFSIVLTTGLYLPNTAAAVGLGLACHHQILVHFTPRANCDVGLYCSRPLFSNDGICVPATALVDQPISAVPGIVGGAIADAANSVAGSYVLDTFAKGIAVILLFIPLLLTGLFSFIASTLLQWILGISLVAVNYTSTNPSLNPAVAEGWPIVRNFADMVVVLAFVVIALSLILGFKNWDETKKVLIKWAIAALLINFSLVICGVVIDISNVTMRYFLTGGQGGDTTTVGAIISRAEWDQTLAIVTNPFTPPENASAPANESDSLRVFIMKALGQIFFNIMKGIVGFLYVFLFLFRIMALWILVILSPLAFACAVFPQTKALVFDKWLSNFLQWCFIGLFGSIFLYLGQKIQATMATAPTGIFRAPATGGTDLYFQNITGLFGFLVPGFFLAIGFMFSLQLSAMGANYATAYGKKVGVYGASAAMNKGGITRAKEVAIDRATRLGEAVGFVPKGTANVAAQKRLEAAGSDKRMASISTKERQSLTTGIAFSEEAKNDKAAAIRIATEKGELRNFTKDQRREAMAFGIANKGSRSAIEAEGSFLKADPDLAPDAKYSIAEDVRNSKKVYSPKNITDYKATHPGISDADVMKGLKTDDAIKALRNKSFTRYDNPDIAKMNNEDLIKLVDDKTADGAKAAEEAVKRGITMQIKNGNINEIGKLLNSYNENYGSDAINSAGKEVPLLNKHNEKKKSTLLTTVNPATRVNYTQTEAEEKLVSEGFAKADPDTISKMPLSKFTTDEKMQFIDSTTAQKISKAGEKLSADERKTLKDLVPEIVRRRALLRPGTDAPKRKQLREVADAIDLL